jgi:hypothetical protein
LFVQCLFPYRLFPALVTSSFTCLIECIIEFYIYNSFLFGLQMCVLDLGFEIVSTSATLFKEFFSFM